MSLQGLFEAIYLGSAILLAANGQPLHATETIREPLPEELTVALLELSPKLGPMCREADKDATLVAAVDVPKGPGWIGAHDAIFPSTVPYH